MYSFTVEWSGKPKVLLYVNLNIIIQNIGNSKQTTKEELKSYISLPAVPQYLNQLFFHNPFYSHVDDDNVPFLLCTNPLT